MIVNKAYKKAMRTPDNKDIEKYRYHILYGGAGSGKSHFGYQNLITLVMKYGLTCLIVRKVAATLKNSVFEALQEIIINNGLSNVFTANKTNMSFACQSGGKILSSGLDDVEKIKSIANIDFIVIEEASELDEKDLEQLDLRIRGVGKLRKFIILMFNPIDENHWLKARFFDRKCDDALIIHTTYKDNKFLDDDYIRKLEELKDRDRYYYDVYCLGKWGSISNTRIFNNYVIEDFEIDKDATTYSGMDFGFNDPTAYVKAYIKDQELYVYEKIYESQLTTDDIIKKLGNENDLIMCESANPDKIADLRKSGFNARAVKKGKDSIMAGINFLKQFKKIHIHSSCYGLSKEAALYKWIETKQGIIQDKPVDMNNHSWDALRYAMEPLMIYGQERATVNIGSLGL